MRTVATRLVACILVSMAVMASTASARQDIEDPNTFLGGWYRIALDGTGRYVLGDGHGYASGTWYCYPQEEGPARWRQWFYNAPYDPNRQGQLDFAVYITPVDANHPTYALVRYNWSTPEWSRLGKRRPPLPFDAPTPELQARYMDSEVLHLVDNLMIETVEPVRSHIVAEYNPEWISIDIEGCNAYVYRGAFGSCLPKDPEMGACYDPDTADCYTCYPEQCRPPYVWLGPGSSCAEYLAPKVFPAPVYRFWSPIRRSHLFTSAEREKDELVSEHAGLWTFEGIAYGVLLDDTDPQAVPVYGFWSPVLGAYFYTIDEVEKDAIIKTCSDVWSYEGPVFYAYSPAAHPPDASPVYRFWSDELSYHFYTISESERDSLITQYPDVWTYEEVAWYAYTP